MDRITSMQVFAEVARRLDVMPNECVMVGDRMVDDVSGALEAGMPAIWRKNESGFPSSNILRRRSVDIATRQLPLRRRNFPLYARASPRGRLGTVITTTRPSG